MVRFSTPAAMADQLASLLLRHYDREARTLPWRIPPRAQRRPDPYAVWLSEIMLQQTTVAAVIPYFEKFLTKWSRVEDLAAAPLEEVLAAWAGLGYYARARNLHKCAGVVARDLGGRFPDTATALQALPGIGPYTAAAIAAIAFDRPEAAVDGNVERVMARLFAVEEPLPGAKAELRRLAASLVPQDRPGDYAQAVMDLGATVCTPRRPKCLLCPWNQSCQAHMRGLAEDLPRRAADRQKPVRQGVAYWIEAPHPETQEAAVLLVRRAARGMLGGMLALPSEGWDATGDQPALPAVEFTALEAGVRHTFTHFHLELKLRAVRLTAPPAIDGEWWLLKELKAAGLPTLMMKAAKLGLTWSRRLS